jgi:hypothetical protein
MVSYWRAALDRLGEFQFEVRNVFVGAGSITIHYKAVLGLEACEVFFFGEGDKVRKAAAHYAGLPPG